MTCKFHFQDSSTSCKKRKKQVSVVTNQNVVLSSLLIPKETPQQITSTMPPPAVSGRENKTKKLDRPQSQSRSIEKRSKVYLGVVGLAVSSPPGFLARGLRIRQVTFRMGSELDEGDRVVCEQEKEKRREQRKWNPVQ